MDIDDVVRVYKKCDSICATADELGITECTVTKALITAGAYANATSEKVAELREQGMSQKEIAETMRISTTTVSKYTPYTNRKYVFGEKTKNALKIRRHRDKAKRG